MLVKVRGCKRYDNIEALLRGRHGGPLASLKLIKDMAKRIKKLEKKVYGK
jgi:hypothetical protein